MDNQKIRGLTKSNLVRRWLASLSIFIVGGCGPGKMNSEPYNLDGESDTGVKGTKENAAASAGAKKPEDDGNAVKEKQRLTFKADVDDSLASLQVKSTVLLRATIEECFGKATSTFLRRDMYAADSFLTNAEKVAFEQQGKAKFISKESPYMGFVQVSTDANPVVTFSGAVPDVLVIEAPRLEDLSGSGRANASADSLSDRYLRSMETVGQVVAHNCDLESQGCKCNSLELATAMLSRCMPLIEVEPTQLREAAKQMATQCASGPLGTRRAIAALVGSYAFALRR